MILAVPRWTRLRGSLGFPSEFAQKREPSASNVTNQESEAEAMRELRAAFRAGELALYLGAGVSAANGLPNWNRLVLAMYFAATHGDWKYDWRPFPNYLFAIAEWQLGRSPEPPEITAQKIRQLYENQTEFLEDLHDTLYAGFRIPGSDTFLQPSATDLLRGNTTLKAVVELLRRGQRTGGGVRAVVTYNYDNLLEIASASRLCEFGPVWKTADAISDGPRRPIIHVHGYIPLNAGRPRGPKTFSLPEEIVFTESQYHAASNDPYSWSNLAQIQCISGLTGLMVGLSLTDRNMRRLLNALRRAPLCKRNFAFLRRPAWAPPSAEQLQEIHQRAKSYEKKFADSGLKSEGKRNEEMLEIFEALNSQEDFVQRRVLEGLGITPLWYANHEELQRQLLSIARR
jgi:hypothetical protein